MELKDKVAVVTGGAAGIGRCGAITLGAAGCSVVVADVDEAGAKQTAADIELAGGRAIAVICDVTDDAAVESLADQANRTFGHVDILWNHAGTSVAGPPERIPVARWRQLHELNVLGGVRGMIAFVPAMMARRSGHLIFTTSGLGLFPDDLPGLGAPYVITKAAQIALARTLAPYLAPHGIGVSLLAPDITATKHTFQIPTVDLDPALVAANLDLAALQQPEDVATRLVEGLRADEFLISLVPRTHERLVEDAKRNYAPRSAGQRPVVHRVRVEADPAKHAELAAVLAANAEIVAHDPGVIAYEVTADLTRPGVFHIFEEFETAAAMEQHAATTASQALLGRMGEFGIAHLVTRLYGVDSIDGVAVSDSAG